jgi:hypothetical protein
MRYNKLLALFLSLIWATTSFAQIDSFIRRKSKYSYTYKEREHTTSENLNHIGGIYIVSWGTYYLTQPSTFRKEGSFNKYRDNLGEIVFDKDEPIWNWVVHPYSGSQLYLYYRANGYNSLDSVKMAFISSTLFEFFVEIYTEPASFQDIYQTPILGSILGIGIEKVSLYLLNTGNPAAKVFGHILNPFTLFWFYEGRVFTSPIVDGKGKYGMLWNVEF